MPWNVRMGPLDADRNPELAPQPADPDTKVVELAPILRPPHRGQQLRVEDHAIDVGGQLLQQQPLGPRERDPLPAARDGPAAEIHVDVRDVDHARGTGGRPSQDGADPCPHLVRVEGLRDVVVGAEVEAARDLARGALRGQQDDRDRRDRADAPEHRQPVDVGHQDIEEDQVGLQELERREPGLSAGGGLDVEPLVRERRGDELADPRLVVHDEHESPRSHTLLLPRTRTTTSLAPQMVRPQGGVPRVSGPLGARGAPAARARHASRPRVAPATLLPGPVAQRSEQGAFNPRVLGSNPSRLTAAAVRG